MKKIRVSIWNHRIRVNSRTDIFMGLSGRGDVMGQWRLNLQTVAVEPADIATIKVLEDPT
jgi:hypothetical protein